MLNFDASYPGIGIKVELIVMREYLKQLDNSIHVICESYETKELSKCKEAEYYENDHVFQVSEEKLPRIIRLPFVVAIHSLYENSVTQLLKYSQKKENKPFCLTDINGKTLTSKFNKFLKHILDYEIQFKGKFLQDISNLTKIRNCIVHANGNLDALSEHKRKKIKYIESSSIGISTDIFQLIVSSEYLQSSFEFIATEIELLMDYIENKYQINKCIQIIR